MRQKHVAQRVIPSTWRRQTSCSKSLAICFAGAPSE
jgi:hypothetical protein